MQFVRVGARVLNTSHRPGSPGFRPIVFSNSLGTDFRIWDGVRDLLPTVVPVLAMDVSGHGLSDMGASSIADHAADVAGVMDHFGLRDAVICGVSMGGLIGQNLAVTRPDLVAGLVLSNTGARIGTEATWSERIAMVQAGGLEPMAAAILERWFSPSFRAQQPDSVAVYRNMLTRTPAAGYAAACAAIRDADQVAATATLRLPVACIAGGEDQATPPDLVRALADLIPEASYEEIAGVGHLPSIETPARVADIVMALHRRVP
jgi:3-oxoadipate enol-lactonase